jgi:hypothetical protein
LKTWWKQCQQISVVYITFEKHTFQRCLYQYKGERMKAILNSRFSTYLYTLNLTIQYVIVARITAVMIFFKDIILVTNRDAFYQTKTYTISSTGGSFRQSTLQGAGSCSGIGIMGMMPKGINY